MSGSHGNLDLSEVGMAAMDARPIFSFGVVADIQYADKDNGSYEGRIQRYRESTAKLDVAISEFNSQKHRLLCVLTLGDIIDGNETDKATRSDFESVLESLSKLEVSPVYHVIGNHCLSLSRDTLLESLQMPGRYYSVVINPGWRLVVLDSMDLSVKWPQGTPEQEAGESFLASNLLSEEKPQMSTWNGGIGRKQMEWLKLVLKDAEMSGEKVIVAMHHPILEGSAPAMYLLWNHEEVREVLIRSASVVAVFCGHYHVGGYKVIEGKHFIVIEGIVEAPKDQVAHAIIEVQSNCINIRGYGIVTSRVLPLLK